MQPAGAWFLSFHSLFRNPRDPVGDWIVLTFLRTAKTIQLFVLMAGGRVRAPSPLSGGYLRRHGRSSSREDGKPRSAHADDVPVKLPDFALKGGKCLHGNMATMHLGGFQRLGTDCGRFIFEWKALALNLPCWRSKSIRWSATRSS